MKRSLGILILLLSSLVLSACSNNDEQDIKSWIKESTKDMKGKVAALPQAKANEDISYEFGNSTDPFQSKKIDPKSRSGKGNLQPDLNRRKEPLESFPLESIKMIGTLVKKNITYGLVKADRTYLVRTGNYMGQNFGVISKISDTEITLKELVEDSNGEWVDRTSSLQLQEQEAKK